MNDILNTQEDQAHDTKWIKDKIADIKDRSCRNNIKIHGILELVQPTDLSSCARGLIKAILPDTKNIELVIDHLHRLPKPAFLSDTVPRNIILRIQFYHVKELYRKQEHWEPNLTPMASCKFSQTYLSIP